MAARLFILLIAMQILLPAAHAQYNYSLNYQTNTISGVTSNWVGNGTYVVGSNTYLNALIINSGGALTDTNGYIGDSIGGSKASSVS